MLIYNKKLEPKADGHPELVSGSHREPILMLHCGKEFVKTRSEMLN